MKSIKKHNNSSSLKMPKVSWRVYLAERIFLKVGPQAKRIADLLEHMSQAIAVGLLGKKALNEYIRKVYQDDINWYNPRRYKLDCEEKVLPLLAKYHTSGRLLNAFCGQGREAKFFAENGFDVTGIDLNRAMIDQAIIYSQEVGFQASFEVADFYQYATKSHYDVVYTSPWMYSTFPDPADRIRLLNKCADLLTPKGVIIISYSRMSHPELFRQKAHHWIAVATSVLTGSDWRPKFGDQLHRQIFYHYFTSSEITAEVETAGFKIVVHQESKDGLFNFCILTLAD